MRIYNVVICLMICLVFLVNSLLAESDPCGCHFGVVGVKATVNAGAAMESSATATITFDDGTTENIQLKEYDSNEVTYCYPHVMNVSISVTVIDIDNHVCRKLIFPVYSELTEDNEDDSKVIVVGDDSEFDLYRPDNRHNTWDSEWTNGTSNVPKGEYIFKCQGTIKDSAINHGSSDDIDINLSKYQIKVNVVTLVGVEAIFSHCVVNNRATSNPDDDEDDYVLGHLYLDGGRIISDVALKAIFDPIVSVGPSCLNWNSNAGVIDDINAMETFITFVGWNEATVIRATCGNDSYGILAYIYKVSDIRWKQKDSPVDGNVGSGIGSGSENVGKRIFPGKREPDDTIDYSEIYVETVILPPSFPGDNKIDVFFKSYDMDDPSDDDGVIDGDTEGDDNRGTPKVGTLENETLEFDSDKAKLVFKTTNYPGDNFMVAASCCKYYPNTLQIKNRLELYDPLDYRVSKPDNDTLGGTPSGVATELLTVWRKIYVEFDSMKRPTFDQNTWNGKRWKAKLQNKNHNIFRIRTQSYFEQRATSEITSFPNDTEFDRGYITLKDANNNNAILEVQTYTAGQGPYPCIWVGKLIDGNLVHNATGINFHCGDDDFNQIIYKNGVFGSRVVPSAADMTVSIKAYRQAYILPVNLVGYNNINAYDFKIWSPTFTTYYPELNSMVNKKKDVGPCTKNYWAATFGLAFQPGRNEDNDGEDGMTLGISLDLIAAERSNNCVIFTEVSEYESGAGRNYMRVSPHELFHAITGYRHSFFGDTDKQLMNSLLTSTVNYFTDDHLLLLRKINDNFLIF